MKRFLSIVLFLLFSFPATAEIVEGYDVFEKRRPMRLDNTGRIIGATYVLDPCEAIAGWTALSNDTTGIAIDLDHVMGAASLEWDKVDGTDNLTVGGIQKTITAVNLTFLIENAGAFGYSLNVSSVANIDYCFIRVGTDATNYNEWRIDDTALRTGWNSLRFNINAPATAGTLGNGWNSSVVTYIALGCNHDLETDLLTDARVDHIVVHAGLQVAADVNANASSSGVGGTDVNISKVGGNATDVDAGLSGIGTLRITQSTDDIVSISDDDNANTVGNPIYMQISQDGTNAVDATHPIPISDDMAANTVANPIAVQLSQDGTNAVDATHPIPISDDLAANAVTNPIFTQLSQDGTNPVQTANPLPVSATIAANTLANPMFIQISQDGTNPIAAANPIPVSATMAANATANRIFVNANTDQILGTATNVNGGNRDAGTQTTTLADDDPAVLALAAMAASVIVDDAAFTPGTSSVSMAGFEFDDATPDAVDEGDGGAARMSANRNVYMTVRDSSGNERGLDITATGGAEVDIATQTLTALKVSATAAVNTANNPIYISSAGSTSTLAAASGATDATPDLILGAQDISEHKNWGIHIWNNGGGGNPLTDADVQVSRDGGSTYFSLTWTACDTLADAADCDYDFPFNSYTHLRVYTTSTVGTSVTIQMSARK